jgi:hypothetical protein
VADPLRRHTVARKAGLSPQPDLIGFSGLFLGFQIFRAKGYDAGIDAITSLPREYTVLDGLTQNWDHTTSQHDPRHLMEPALAPTTKSLETLVNSRLFLRLPTLASLV